MLHGKLDVSSTGLEALTDKHITNFLNNFKGPIKSWNKGILKFLQRYNLFQSDFVWSSKGLPVYLDFVPVLAPFGRLTITQANVIQTT